MDLRMRVRKFIAARDLLRPGGRVVVGVSGGPDSLCLLDLLHALAGDLGLSLHVAHLNHGLRPAATSEADFVRVEAEKRRLPFHTETADTRTHALREKKSIEEAARELRYAFLASTAVSVKAHTIAVAHTANDQAETVLMHFLRGSGVSGLRGMQPKVEMGGRIFGEMEYLIPKEDGPTFSERGLYLIRPLLAVMRTEVEAYCAEQSLNPVQDPTNLDTAYFRNRLRHELLPELEKYNPNIRTVLSRTAEVMAGEHEILGRAVEALWQKMAQTELWSRVRLDRQGWLALTRPEQRALLRYAVAWLRPGLRDVDFVPLERAIQFSLTAQPGRNCDLLGGLRLSVSLKHIMVDGWRTSGAPIPSHLPLIAENGQLRRGWHFHIETQSIDLWPLDEVESNSSDWQVFVDATAIQLPVRVRARLPGDRFQPLGLQGHRTKVSDFMINAKIDAALRDRWPIVVSGDEIVWVAGLRLDERFKVTPTTERVMRLSFVKNEDNASTDDWLPETPYAA